MRQRSQHRRRKPASDKSGPYRVRIDSRNCLNRAWKSSLCLNLSGPSSTMWDFIVRVALGTERLGAGTAGARRRMDDMVDVGVRKSHGNGNRPSGCQPRLVRRWLVERYELHSTVISGNRVDNGHQSPASATACCQSCGRSSANRRECQSLGLPGTPTATSTSGPQLARRSWHMPQGARMINGLPGSLRETQTDATTRTPSRLASQ